MLGCEPPRPQNPGRFEAKLYILKGHLIVTSVWISILQIKFRKLQNWCSHVDYEDEGLKYHIPYGIHGTKIPEKSLGMNFYRLTLDFQK